MAAYTMKSDNIFLRCFDMVAIEVYKLDSPYTFPKKGKSWDNLGIRIGPGNKYEVLKIGDKEINDVELKTLIKDVFNSGVIVNREGLGFLATAAVTAAALEVEYYRMFDLFDWSKYHVNTSLNTRWARRDFVDGRPLDVVKPVNSSDDEKKIIRDLEMKLENQKREHKEEIEEILLEKREEFKRKDDEIERLKEELSKKKQEDTKEKQEEINERKEKDDEIEKLKEKLTKEHEKQVGASKKKQGEIDELKRKHKEELSREHKKQEDAMNKKQGEIDELKLKHKEELSREHKKQEDAMNKKQGEMDELKRKHKEELSKEHNKQEDAKKKNQDEIEELKRKNREQLRNKQGELNDLEDELKIFSFARSGYGSYYIRKFYNIMLQKIQVTALSTEFVFVKMDNIQQDKWPPVYGTLTRTFVPLASPQIEINNIQIRYRKNTGIPTMFDKSNWRVICVAEPGTEPEIGGFMIRRAHIAYYDGNRNLTDAFVYGSGDQPNNQYKEVIPTPLSEGYMNYLYYAPVAHILGVGVRVCVILA